MQIRRDHPIVRVAYFFQGQEPPRWGRYSSQPYQTSLCPLFWRCMASLAFFAAVGALTCVLCFLLGRAAYRTPWSVWRNILTGMAIGVGVVGSVIGIVSLGIRFKWGRRLATRLEATAATFDDTAESITDSVAWQMLKSVKSKMCPLVTFTEK